VVLKCINVMAAIGGGLILMALLLAASHG